MVAWLLCGARHITANGRESLSDTQALDSFLASVERRAFRIAQIALRDTEDALDAVQDAMLKLVQCYASKPQTEWAPLFYSILRRRITDIQRRRQVRNRVIVWFGNTSTDDDEETWDPTDTVADPGNPDPLEVIANSGTMAALEIALATLPPRQQQAFMLRILEGLDVAQTAHAMGCSGGSVKTHLSRAVHTLRLSLENHR